MRGCCSSGLQHPPTLFTITILLNEVALMEIKKIQDLVQSRGINDFGGVVDVPWADIERLLEDNVDCPDKKKRFKMKLKPSLTKFLTRIPLQKFRIREIL